MGDAASFPGEMAIKGCSGHMRSIRTRLSLSFAAIIITTLGLFLAAVHLAAVAAIETHVADQMRTGMTMFRADWQRQQRQMAQLGHVLAQDFGFRAAVATGDHATIASALINATRRSGLSAALLIGPEDKRLAQGVAPATADWTRIIRAVDDGARSGVLMIRGQPFQAVAIPVRAPQPIATLVIARHIGPTQLAAFRDTVSIALDAAIVPAPQHDAQAPTSAEMTAARMVTLDYPLPHFGTTGSDEAHKNAAILRLTYPIARAYAPFRPIQLALGLISAGALAAALLASWFLARDITGPLRMLRDAAARLGSGEVASVPAFRGAEIGGLADSFNRMAQAVAQREARITHLYTLACHDAMTGLPNRTVMQEALTEALADPARHGMAGVFFIDIDGFKQINDRLGHAAGDALICGFAERCRIILGEALLARMGGDEFAALVPGDHDRLRAVAQALVSAAALPFDLGGQMAYCGASVGIAIVGEEGLTPDRLLHHADIALYAAKAAGKGCCRFYHEGGVGEPNRYRNRPALTLVTV